MPISSKNPKLVLNLFFSSLIFVVVFDVLLVIAEDFIFNWFVFILIFFVGTINVLIMVMLAKFPQTRTVGFATPLGNKKNDVYKKCDNFFNLLFSVPMTPILGIAINIYLMLRLSSLTLVRFGVWMLLGNSSHDALTFFVPFFK